MAKYEKLKKNLNYLFINTASDSVFGSEKWARVGKSTEWTDTMNAKTKTYEYIEDSGPTDVIESYQPSTSMPLTAYVGDPVYEYVFDLYHRQEIAGNSVTRALRVFQNKTADGAYKAQVTDCSTVIENFNFSTGVITFAIKQGGTPISGTASVTESMDESGNKIWTPVFAAE
ncbi:MAG: hypothetical protein FWD71_03275 [Oscillospiraceae bacterium]|nr:hypothetical protein [Oscillospiraceae bacterium]